MPLGIVVNPMSGRDVRRVAARANTNAHRDKQQQLTRLVLGALEQGVDEIWLGNEPFRINRGAVENLAERDRIHLLDYPLTHTADDTTRMMSEMWDRGCRCFIILGGDGTNRIAAKQFPDAIILPLSTGTNNVFPWMVEASVAGAAAGIIASGKVDPALHCPPCKQIHIRTDGIEDTALIDAVLLRDDTIGNLLPFDPDKIASIFLTRAEPAAIGMSPAGGYLMPCSAADEYGVQLECGKPAATSVRIPISAGLYGNVGIRDYGPFALGETRYIEGPGVLAFDGDRAIRLGKTDSAAIGLERDGPRIIDARIIMTAAAEAGLLRTIHE